MEHQLRMLENRVLTRMFGSEKTGVINDGEIKLPNKVRYDAYPSSRRTVIKSHQVSFKTHMCLSWIQLHGKCHQTGNNFAKHVLLGWLQLHAVYISNWI
jgi:hypothetical protein